MRGEYMAGLMPFGLKIAIIYRAFRKRLDEKAAAMGLTSVQLRVLGSVSRLQAAGQEEIHQNDLERIERVTHPAMTKMLQRLESKGFIHCVPSKKDRRYKVVTCTPQSEGIHKMILAQDAQVLAELCEEFTQEQINALLELTDLLLDKIGSER